MGLSCNGSLVVWKKEAFDQDGNLIEVSESTNLFVDTGRVNMIKGCFPFTTSAVTMVAMSAGASGMAPDYPDDRLKYEFTGNANRYSLTKVGGAALPLADVDITSLQQTINGYLSRKNFQVQATLDYTDGNNGQTIQEYGLHSTTTLPGTPTGLSGVMANRWVDPSPTTKTSLVRIVVTITVYI